MPKSYYKSIKRAMTDQHKRKYGQNKHGDYIFTGKDPHGGSTNRSFCQTFRNPNNRNRESANNNNSQSSFGNAPLGINTHARSDECSKARMARPSDRTTEASYGDAIRIRFLQNENADLKEDIAAANDKEENLKDEIKDLKEQLEKAENRQRRLLKLIEVNPCRLVEGSWTLEIDGMPFRSDKTYEKGEL